MVHGIIFIPAKGEVGKQRRENTNKVNICTSSTAISLPLLAASLSLLGDHTPQKALHTVTI